MKYFKVKAMKTANKYEVSAENFEKQTERKYPFEQFTGRTVSQYAICPVCLNPIQLIGIAKNIKYKPYGKHTGKDIDGLPGWDFIEYRYCPYAAKGSYIEPNDDEELIITERTVELYNLLKSQFDRVVYIISKELEINCSLNFWEKALNQYINSQIYTYRWLTEDNLPYIFAYRGMAQANIFGQKFIKGTDLYNTLAAYPNVKFDESGRLGQNGGYFKLVFRFTDFKQSASDGEELKEKMKFCIDDNNTGKTVYERIVEFNEDFFRNLINKGNDDKRQHLYLKMAEKLMPDIGNRSQ